MAPARSVKGKHIAVVGSGVSGLASAWLLQHHGAEVTLFEAQDACGGHTLTDHTSGFPVDLGFQVYNLSTYPHLVSWFEHLGVATEPSNMSFSLSLDGGSLEWASHGLGAVFAQRRNLLSLRFWGMLWDVLRFGRRAPDVLAPHNAAAFRDVSLGAYLARNGYGQAFIDHYIVPMSAAVWSVPAAKVLDFPVQLLVRFWVNHHLLNVLERPLWRVVRGRSAAYVRRALQGVQHVRTGTPVRGVAAVVTAQGPKVDLQLDSGTERFDLAVLATHSDTARQLRGADATDVEASVLEAIPYNTNEVYLHTDDALMPRRRACWASWNFLGSSAAERRTDAVCVTYYVQSLQRLPPAAPQLFVTLNPPTPPDAAKTFNRLPLAHPEFGFASWRAQARLPEMQGSKGCVYYAGAWCGYGFHEDGMRAAVAVLDALQLPLPWVPCATSPHCSLLDSRRCGALRRYLRASVREGALTITWPWGADDAFGDADASAAEAPYRVACSYAAEHPHRAGTAATAVHVDLSVAREADAEVLAGPGPSGRPAAAHVRVLSVHNALGLATRLPLLALLRAYAARDLEVDDLGALCGVLLRNWQRLLAEGRRAGLAQRLGAALAIGGGARGLTLTAEAVMLSAERAFDACGIALYERALDCDLHLTPALHSSSDAVVEDAHAAFDAAALAAAGVGDGSNVLEIGGGFGALAVHALAQHACRWTASTVSKTQLERLSTLADAQSIDGRLQPLFAEWRRLGTALPARTEFDSILCVDPHTSLTVGRALLPAFLTQQRARLAPRGTITLLATLLREDCAAAMDASQRAHAAACLQHLGIGAPLATRAQLSAAALSAGLREVRRLRVAQGLGAHNAATLRGWRLRLAARWREARMAGVSDHTLRRWEMAAALLEAAFEEGIADMELVTWTHGEGPLPQCRLDERGLPPVDPALCKARIWSHCARLACVACVALLCWSVAKHALAVGGQGPTSPV